MNKYQEIKELHKFLKQHKIKHKFSRLYDGYQILFQNREDCVQHYCISLSYGRSDLIEFWIKDKDDIRVMTLEEAKKFVLKRYYKGE